MFSLPHPGYLQQNRDSGGLLLRGLCVPEKWHGRCSDAFFVGVCVFVLSTLTRKLNYCVLGSAMPELVKIRQNFWVVGQGRGWNYISFYFGFCLILLFKWNSYTEVCFSGLQKERKLLPQNYKANGQLCNLNIFSTDTTTWYHLTNCRLSASFKFTSFYQHCFLIRHMAASKLFFIGFLCSRQQRYLQLSM